jgi:hypothetical protein
LAQDSFRKKIVKQNLVNVKKLVETDGNVRFKVACCKCYTGNVFAPEKEKEQEKLKIRRESITLMS